MNQSQHEQTAMVSPEVFQQIGSITRMLHDTMYQLGVMPRLQQATSNIPDARSRLTYVAEKTQSAANRVLDTVDAAKNQQQQMLQETREMAQAITQDPVRAVASGTVLNYVQSMEAYNQQMDGHLTNIMMAQDFHDLTGQVVAKVVTLANDLEDSLVQLLKQIAPPELAQKQDELNGPVVDSTRTDVVHNQNEVDDLLASMGF